ncbi:MAG: glycosyltransferase, partial [Verrucomicrobiota bacterium]
SLFEGFGMPVLEAMAFDKPVLCSNVTSLPEVAGNAALLFDPRKPLEIAGAIEQLAGNPELAGMLVERGRKQLATFADANGMAQQYWQVFQTVFANADFTSKISGIHTDGWTGDNLSVSYGPSDVPRYLELKLFAPEWLPHKKVTVTLTGTDNDHSETQIIPRGQKLTVRQQLPVTGGLVRVKIKPVFQPQAHNFSADSRYLGCLCRSCRILSANKIEELFHSE